MEALLYLAIAMFFIGIIQLIIGAIFVFATKTRKVRRHFGYYWLGVLIYFLVLLALSATGENPVTYFWFFVPANGLMIYQIVILVSARRWAFDEKEDARIAYNRQQQRQKAQNSQQQVNLDQGETPFA